jgi:hypothetical protein
MVDNSTSPFKRISGWFSLHSSVQRGRFVQPLATAICTELSLPFREPLLASGALNRPIRDRRQRRTEDCPRCPSSVGSAGYHGWSPLAVALRQTFAPSLSRLDERHSEGSMGLKMGSRESFLRSKDKQSLPCCQASGREVRIIHHRESLDPLATFEGETVSFRN